MKRIMVIGCSGSGKSTFSRALHKMTGIRDTVIFLDYSLEKNYNFQSRPKVMELLDKVCRSKY